MADMRKLTDATWREKLSPEAYRVLRQHGTERPFSSPLNVEERDGIYVCAGCGTPLFRSVAKFDAGCGWPSYFEPISPEVITELSDTSLGVERTEIRCSACDGHLGHVFPDGPAPTGLRYCVNGAALSFTPDSER